MDFNSYPSLGYLVLLVGLSTIRIFVAFILLPVFGSDTVPVMVRNTIFLAMGVLVLALQPPIKISDWGLAHWMVLYVKEALLGLALSFGMAAFMWAFDAAGQIVDTKFGASNSQLVDPLSGQQVSLSGAFLGRLINFLFMAGGGFLLYVGVLLESFHAFPVSQMDLTPRIGMVEIFERHMGNFMVFAFLISAPALVVMFLVDLVLGFINRFAQQLNVTSIQTSLKGVASTAVWMLMLATLVEGFQRGLGERLALILPQLTRMLSSGGA